jgi:hypothetical protein
MSKPKQHSKKPGAKKIATGQANGAEKGKGCAWKIDPYWKVTRQELISVRGKSL